MIGLCQKKNSLGVYKKFNVIKTTSDSKLVIDESVPYCSSSNTVYIELILKNKEDIKNYILKLIKIRVTEKSIYRLSTNSYATYVKAIPKRNTNQYHLEDILEHGEYRGVTGNGGNIYETDDVDMLVEELSNIFDDVFFDIDLNPYFEARRGYYNTSEGKRNVIISPSTRKGILYQLTILNDDEPIGHLNMSSLNELDDVVKMMDIKLI